MRTSESLDVIAPALLAAQSALPPLKKDSVNPHFKSAYLSLEGLLAAVRPALSACGLTIIQSTVDGDDAGLTVVTRILHKGGQWVEGAVRLPLEKPTSQAAGSAFSYGRRYGLEAILGITATEDDDANVATVHTLTTPAKASRPGPERTSKPVPTQPREDVPPPSCPTCDGPMWDNRATKKNPKAPDWKCKDKACDGVFWPGEWPPKAVAVGPADSPPPPDEPPMDDELPF